MTSAFRIFPLSSQIVVGSAQAPAAFNPDIEVTDSAPGYYDFAAAQAQSHYAEAAPHDAFSIAALRINRLHAASAEGDGSERSTPPPPPSGSSSDGSGRGGPRINTAGLHRILTGTSEQIQERISGMGSYDELFQAVARDSAIPSLKFEGAEAAVEQIKYFENLLSALETGLTTHRSDHASVIHILHFIAKSAEESAMKIYRHGGDVPIDPNRAFMPLLRTTDAVERRMLFKGNPSHETSMQLAEIYDIVARKGLSYETALMFHSGHGIYRYYASMTTMMLLNVARRYAKLRMDGEVKKIAAALDGFRGTYKIPESSEGMKAWAVGEFTSYIQEKATEASEPNLSASEAARRIDYVANAIDLARRGNYLFAEEMVTAAADIVEERGLIRKAGELRSWIPIERLFAEKMGLGKAN